MNAVQSFASPLLEFLVFPLADELRYLANRVVEMYSTLTLIQSLPGFMYVQLDPTVCQSW